MVDLNDHLMPVDSPIAQNQGLMTAMEFDSKNDPISKIRNASIGSAQIQDASIGSAQVGTLSFNNISGGTATLGGTTNGNGLMQVLNASGGTVVQVDNTGISVTGGSVSIKNASGSTIIDSSGLNGLSTFQYGQGSAVTYQDITSVGTASYTDITNGSVTVVLARQSNVFLTSTITGKHNNDGDGIGVIRFTDGGTEIGPHILIRTFGTGEFSIADTHSASFITTLSAGTHAIKLQATQNNISGTLTLTNESATDGAHTIINYLVLGN